MAGLYLHIPFCKKKCDYCNFHFSTNLRFKSELISAIAKEIEWQKDIFNTSEIDTIYFGGGTPSLLSQEDFDLLFNSIFSHYKIVAEPEITIEANPEDINETYLSILSSLPINRLSIGVQSFDNMDLQFLGRIHNSERAFSSIRQAQDFGFTNISIDFIYGIQTLSDSQWKSNIEKAFQLGIPHVSAYALTIEERTALAHKSKIKPEILMDEAQVASQFEILIQMMEERNYIQYEISNFSIQGFRSRHNSSYWNGSSYLGFGPSAHSYFYDSIKSAYKRQWNISNNIKYLNQVKQNKLKPEFEYPSTTDLYNEYLLTNLRTEKGISLSYIKNTFDIDFSDLFARSINQYNQSGLVKKDKDIIKLTNKGKLFADRITSELFLVKE